jgi:gentisate 1,2-dioxygenase
LNREIVQHVFTKRNRHTSSGAYFVVGGEGTSIVGDKVLEWSKHDCFAVPTWAWHEHVNRSKSEAAILFSVNNIPIFEAFGPGLRGIDGIEILASLIRDCSPRPSRHTR